MRSARSDRRSPTRVKAPADAVAIVGVGRRVVNQAARQELERGALYGSTEPPDERARSERREHPRVHEPFQRVPVLHEGRTAFDVREDDAMSAFLKLQQEGFDSRSHANQRGLDQQPWTAAKRETAQFLIAETDRPHQRDLGTCLDAHRDGELAEVSVQPTNALGDRARRVRPLRADVRGRNDRGDTDVRRCAGQGDGRVQIRRTIVDPGK